MNRYLTIPFKSLLFAWFSYLVWSEKEGEDGEDGEDKVDGKKGANDAEEDVALDKGEIHFQIGDQDLCPSWPLLQAIDP